MKKYLIYSNTGLSSRQIGLTAEYLKQCSKEEIELKIVYCDNVLENCYFNPLHNSLACASCQSRSMELYKQIGIPKENLIPLKKNQFEVDIPFFNTLKELIDFEFEGTNVGRGTASSIISYYRDYHVSSHTHKNIIEFECKKAINVLINFKCLIQDEAPDKVILFNGRFSEINPLLKYCDQIELPFSTLESGAIGNYEVFNDSLPHSIVYRHNSIMNSWQNETDLAARNEVAHKWFEKKRNRDDSIEKSYTKNQELDTLPLNFNSSKTNILILNSSEDEMKVLEEFQTDLFETQNEAIKTILMNFEASNQIQFYLRVHPNLGKVDNIQIKEINNLNFKNLTIIGPNEPIDTYAIMMACDKSIVFGSTSGIEATYWGKASILLGKSFYYYMEDTCYKPNSYEELFKLITTENLPPKSKEACLPYGYYFSTYGIKTKYFEYKGLNNSTFKGKRIKKWYPSTFLYAVRYLFQSRKWFRAYKATMGKRLSLTDLFRYKI